MGPLIDLQDIYKIYEMGMRRCGPTTAFPSRLKRER